jgi:hypothetical protein
MPYDLALNLINLSDYFAITIRAVICFSLKDYFLIEKHILKTVNSCWNTKISFISETSGGQNSNIYLNAVHFFSTSFSRTARIRHQ